MQIQAWLNCNQSNTCTNKDGGDQALNILLWDIPKEDSTSMNAPSQRQAEDRKRGSQRGSTPQRTKATGCCRCFR